MLLYYFEEIKEDASKELGRYILENICEKNYQYTGESCYLLGQNSFKNLNLESKIIVKSYMIDDEKNIIFKRKCKKVGVERWKLET